MYGEVPLVPRTPAYESRARFLGELSGSWFEMGLEVGRQSADLVRWVSDVWWQGHVQEWGLADTMKSTASGRWSLCVATTSTTAMGTASRRAPECPGPWDTVTLG